MISFGVKKERIAVVGQMPKLLKIDLRFFEAILRIKSGSVS